jgi:energy-coupling factor transport system ATP-binding protein
LDEQEYKYEGNSECISIPSLSIGENEIVGIVGRNGCGKTTILKSIAGTILSKSETPRKSYSVFGFLSQNVNRQLFANSVKEELYLGIKNISKEKEKYGEFLLYEFGLKGLENTHPVFLSGGQKQKLILASLLMHNPEIVLLDELFTNLDVVSIKKIFFVLSEYRKNNNLSIILTDQQSQILKEICDKMIYL